MLLQKIKTAVVFYAEHTGKHAAYAAAGAGLGYVSLHFAGDAAGLGISAQLAVVIGGAIGTLASRLQAKAEDPAS